MGSARDLDTAKADFKAAWEALKAKFSAAELAAAYKAMNIRDDDRFEFFAGALHSDPP
jgi:hypothetical protein